MITTIRPLPSVTIQSCYNIIDYITCIYITPLYLICLIPGSLYLLIPFNYFFLSPPPSRLVTTSLFSVSMTPFLFYFVCPLFCIFIFKVCAVFNYFRTLSPGHFEGQYHLEPSSPCEYFFLINLFICLFLAAVGLSLLHAGFL